MANTYIYVLKDPENGLVRYVGKSVNPESRFKNGHLHSGSRKTKTACWIKSLKSRGLVPVMEVIDTACDFTWSDTEKFWIKTFTSLGFNLTNLTDGGDDGVLAKESIDKMILTKRERYKSGEIKPWNKGLKGAQKFKRGSEDLRSKKVYAYNLDGGLISEYESASMASLILSGSRNKWQGNISNCCRGMQKTAYGYVFKYA
jgi:hypothetical protein